MIPMIEGLGNIENSTEAQIQATLMGLDQVEEPEDNTEQDDIEEKVIKIVKSDISSGKKANEAEQDIRVKHYNIYRASGDGIKEREGRSRLKSSDTMDAIEWMMPAFMKTFAGSTSSIVVAPVGSEDVEKAEKLENLLNWQFMGQNVQGFNKLYEWIKTSLVYGTSIMKVTWKDTYIKKDFDMPVVSQGQMDEMMSSEEFIDVNAVPEDIMPGTVISQDMFEMAANDPAMLQQIAQVNSESQGVQPVAIAAMRVYREVNGTKKIKSYSGPQVEVISPEDFYMDPDAKSINEAQFVIHRVWRTFGELRDLEEDGIYRNVDDVKDWVDKSRDEFTNSEKAQRYEAAGQTDPSVNSQLEDNDQIARKKLEVFEWWGLLDLEGEGFQEPYLVVFCGESILRMERNPYGHGQAPFEVLRPMLDPFKFTGIGMPELVGEFQAVKTALMRQTLDNISFQNNGMWLVNRNAGVDTNLLMNPRPGGCVMTNIVSGAVQNLAPASLHSMPLTMLELVDSMLQKRTGVTSYNQGLDANSLNKTATGITKIMAASAQRIELIARVMAETGIKPLYQKLLMLNQQFIDQTVVIRVFNQPVEISPDDLIGDFDVSVDVGGATNKDEVRSQQMLMLIQNAGNLTAMGVMRPENIYETCKQLLKTWGWKDHDRYFSDPDETNKLRQIMQIMQELVVGIQQGQVPQIEQVMQTFLQIYQTLAEIAGGDGGGGAVPEGTPSSEQTSQAIGGGASNGQYGASNIPSGLASL